MRPIRCTGHYSSGELYRYYRSSNDWPGPCLFQTFLVVNRARSAAVLIGQLLILTRPLSHILSLIG